MSKRNRQQMPPRRHRYFISYPYAEWQELSVNEYCAVRACLDLALGQTEAEGVRLIALPADAVPPAPTLASLFTLLTLLPPGVPESL